MNIQLLLTPDSQLPTFISLARRGVVETNPNQTFETAG